MARIKTIAPPVEPEPIEVPTPPAPDRPSLPRFRAESIATLTAKARALTEEFHDNRTKVNTLNQRAGVIQREIEDIRRQVYEHAWDGEPLTNIQAY